jgi:hypothetical protein
LKNNNIRSKVESRLLEGATREDIFRELGGTDDVAREIASTPDLHLRKKYAKLNWTLVSILAYFALLKIAISLTGYLYLKKALPWYFFPTLLLVPGAAIYFAVQIRKFRGGFYLIAGLLFVIVILNSCRTLSSLMANYKAFLVWLALYSPLIAGSIIAFFLKKKLFPHLGYLGAKTDSSGSYTFIVNDAEHPAGGLKE